MNFDTKELYLTSVRFFESNGSKPEHANVLVEVAKTFLTDPAKSEKIVRELMHDPLPYAELEKRIMPYFALEKPVLGYKLMWGILEEKLIDLQFLEPENFDVIFKAINQREFRFIFSGGVKKGNLFVDLKIHLGIDSLAVDKFLEDIYSLNVQIGKNPSGKGEYFLDLFVKDTYKSSDVNIEGAEYEIKASNAAVGESLGSKITYQENVSVIYEKSGMKFDYGSFSFGKKNFITKWAPEFVKMSIVSPSSAYELIKYQHEFFLQKDMDKKFCRLLDEYLLSPSVEKLASIYTDICQRYVFSSLEGKSMIVFAETGTGDNKRATGEYVCFDSKSVNEAVCFAGSTSSAPAKVILPKSSATMRPEIQYNPD